MTQWCGVAQPIVEGWHTLRVPGAWETNGPGGAKNYDGIAWYRTWVKPSDTFFSKHERNLFEESVTINIRDLADSHEVFVNGQKIGAGGRFPPSFQSGQGQIHQHKVPVGTLRKGEWNELSLRVFNRSGPGGFLGEAPFIMDYFMECVLEGAWQFRLGDDTNWAGGSLKTRPAASAFDQFRESNRVLGEAVEFVPGPRRSPVDSLSAMGTTQDLVVEQLLHEPLVTQPVHLSYDERGRLWVSQYRQYPYPAGLKMVSRDKYYRSHYDQVPPPPPHHVPGRDIITIHEDTDRDGAFDRHKVFLERLNLANAALRGRGGVWVMHTPYLLFYPDKDFDDVPDGPPVVHLEGFGFEDTHSVANGLVWGMDGWLYGAQGSTTSSHVTRPGLEASDAPGVRFEGCMVWRYQPETREYEIFAEGSGNTFGLEVDSQGRLFSGHNGGATRGWHYVQGGYYLKQGFDPGKFGPPRNPYAFGQLAMMKTDTTVQRFSHFAALAEGTALPRKYTGMFFSLDPLHSVVIASERRVLGATFETSDLGPVLSSSDVAFRPVHIANAPDGSLHIADFYEFYIAHGQHYQNQIDRTTGRIYRLRGKAQPLEANTNLENRSTDDLIALLSHPNKWHRQTAVRLLGERKDPTGAPRMREILKTDSGLTALNALWALQQSDQLDERTALQALRHPYAPVRMWTVRLLADRRQLPRPAAEAIEFQARLEPDAEVRSQMAASARRLAPGQGLPIIAALLARDEDLRDPYVPLLCWWAIESWSAEYREMLLDLFRGAALWDRPIALEEILPRLMRRYALEGRRRDLLTCAQLFRLAPSPRHAAQLMKGFEEAFRGRAIAGLPDELADAIAAAGQSPLTLRVRRGETAAVAEAVGIVANRGAKLDERMLHVRTLGEARSTNATKVLLDVVAHDSQANLRKAALAALSALEGDSIGSEVTALIPKLPNEVRAAALAVLASRAGWSTVLLDSIRSGRIRASLVPADVVDRMRLHQEEPVHSLVAKVFPMAASPLPVELQQRIVETEAILKRGTGNPYAGEATFMERCGICHKLFFKGGNVGPDLTNYQRDNLNTMLMSIINPNAEIREGYQYYLIETKDERSLSGFLLDSDQQVTVLRRLEGEDISLRASEIKEIRPAGRSLMPEGLLNDLDERQLRDLFAYLRISQPITR